jgi:dUTPase
MNLWKRNDVNMANPKLPKTYKEKYNFSNENVDIKVTSDDDFFMPSGNDSRFIEVFCNCKNMITIFNCGFKSVYFGIKLKVPSKYKVCFSLDDKWVSKGLITNGTEISDFNEDDELKVHLFNMNEGPVFINNKDKLGKIWIEPIYLINIL